MNKWETSKTTIGTEDSLAWFMECIEEACNCAWPENLTDNPKSVSLTLFALLLEEAGESAQVARRFYGRPMNPSLDDIGNRRPLIEEFGYLGFTWLRICKHHGIDPAEALRTALMKIEKRIEDRDFGEKVVSAAQDIAEKTYGKLYPECKEEFDPRNEIQEALATAMAEHEDKVALRVSWTPWKPEWE